MSTTGTVRYGPARKKKSPNLVIPIVGVIALIVLGLYFSGYLDIGKTMSQDGNGEGSEYEGFAGFEEFEGYEDAVFDSTVIEEWHGFPSACVEHDAATGSLTLSGDASRIRASAYDWTEFGDVVEVGRDDKLVIEYEAENVRFSSIKFKLSDQEQHVVGLPLENTKMTIIVEEPFSFDGIDVEATIMTWVDMEQSLTVTGIKIAGVSAG